jgi:hypothetical protein
MQGEYYISESNWRLKLYCERFLDLALRQSTTEALHNSSSIRQAQTYLWAMRAFLWDVDIWAVQTYVMPITSHPDSNPGPDPGFVLGFLAARRWQDVVHTLCTPPWVRRCVILLSNNLY